MKKTDSTAAGTSGVRVIVPPQSLALKTAAAGAGHKNIAASIQRAEKALLALSAEFGDWMRKDVDALAGARAEVRQSGKTAATLDALLQVAQEMKGQAQMLGYPFSGLICASLCDLIENAPDRRRIPLDLIDNHVDAVKAELRENADMTNNVTANALVERLRSVTNAFLASETARETTKPAAGRSEPGPG